MADRPLIPLFGVNMCPGAASDVADVLVSGQIAEGDHVRLFEYELAEHLRLPRGRDIVTVNSGTSALELALILADVKPGDDVLTTPMTCTATTTAIINRGARPVWVDVDENGNLDPEDIPRRVTPKTRAIVVVEWGGRPVDIAKVRQAVNHRSSIGVIEDAAHSFRFNDRRDVRGYADFRCFSFQAIKHLTTGDGGAVVMRDDHVARAKRLRWFGLDRSLPRDERLAAGQSEVGFKWHMNNIAAVIGRQNLRSVVASALQHCSDNAGAYIWHLAKTDWDVLYPPAAEIESGWWLFTVRVPGGRRDHFQKYLARRGIETSEVHRRNDVVPAFAAVAGETKPGDLPGLDAFAGQQVSVPVGWWLTQAQRDVVANAMVDFSKGAV
jgi:dTDP-4-amino-4,6-dideoxygalactose transaminase